MRWCFQKKIKKFEIVVDHVSPIGYLCTMTTDNNTEGTTMTKATEIKRPTRGSSVVVNGIRITNQSNGYWLSTGTLCGQFDSAVSIANARSKR